MARNFDPNVLLSKPLMANLATVDADGAPRNAPVWFQWEDGALWMLGTKDGASVRRLTRDPRCAVEIVDYDNAAGILLHLGFRGAAEIRKMDAALFRRLLGKYLGPDEAQWNTWFVETIAAIDDPGGRLIRLVPDSVFTNNVSYFRTGPDLAWPLAPEA
ncbi:General stress protein 26 [Roseivivax halotolerans]|uniref:General stress protein 26 n=1 Tax=Roseivivax halotolerans TaxID=93684 RepID=A0A1I5YR79_9RHOB|nr:pyridoxamine 5'-phosphate oxidase family protein [Roseivivax halotolerans]SFQ46784.1 General stress protein 26 [Roseivivax halotolerans]